ncbi:hypothetical protein ASPZODRAFT_893358 [Penicilliopsis zonata CBS 506.65]|uniref:galacturonan 1,4-alpha-galacturonidase n=1 Tax=Penicilliopsis zonata CBS 506.65 TaxID=1073090 RepID=A0A1L9S9S5_9EURO|nr:hypothetical protein ASPZODRAFT_893358 [Penicilliopsis zonata CBS 506.65]OJJ43913.1 hypothetical protein ASPZODRAFT_893358 [Penicilliopsis zonata CBS 506.65]
MKFSTFTQVVSLSSLLLGVQGISLDRNEACKPFKPFQPLPSSHPRTKTCKVEANGHGRDDSNNILKALKECNNGGKVVFDKDFYTIGTALDMTWLKHIDIEILGHVQFTNDTDYWQENGFFQTYQNATTFFELGGEDVNLYGTGILDGNGQAWYDLYVENELILRPVLVGVIGLNGGTIGPLNLRDSPEWFHFVANSSDVLFDGINIAASSTNSSVEVKNTDGWDVYRSTNIVIQNSIIQNQDDCVSFKPNSTDILVQNLYCNGSHGISVGSLGQYVGEVDIVENVYVYNISMYNAENGARIKVWPGISSELSVDLQGGGGSGYVKNITYDTFYSYNVDYAIDVTQCYGQDNLTLCNDYPSNLTISDVLFYNFSGETSTAYEPIVGTIVCSSPDVCSDINAYDINVVSPIGTNEFQCAYVNETTLAVNCTET